MPDYEIITTEPELDAVIHEISKLPRDNPMEVPVLDIETGPGHPECKANDRFTCELAGIALSWAEDKAAYIPLAHVDGNNLRYNRMVDSSVLETLRKLKAVAQAWEWANHMARFDWGVLRQPRFGLEVNYKYCSYVEAGLTGKFVEAFKGAQGQGGRSDSGLGSIVLKLYGYVMKGLEEIGGKGADGRIDARLVPSEMGAWYGCDDANYARKLHRYFHPLVKDMWLHKVEMPLMPWIEVMETNGIPFNPAICEEQLTKLYEFRPKSRELVFMQAERQLGYRPEVNLNSPAKVAAFFYSPPPDGLGYPCTQTSRKTKKPSVSAKALAQLVKTFDLPHNYMMYKKLMKADDFLDLEEGLPKYIHPLTGLIHSTFGQMGVPSGRFASWGPNAQNWSDEKTYELKDGDHRDLLVLNLRNAVEVPKDELLYFHDNKQAELWVAFEYAKQDDVLEDIGKGWDGHIVTAHHLFHVALELVSGDQRKSAKTRNFAIIYGETAEGMAEKLGISVEEAAQFMQDYFRRFNKVYASRTGIIEQARRDLYVKTYFGRYVDLEAYMCHPDRHMRDHGDRLAYNIICQGTAADIAKIQFLKVCEKLKHSFNPVPVIHQGHDALGYRLTPRNFNFGKLPDFHRTVKSTIEFSIPGFKLPVRTDCKVGWRYGTMVDYNGESYEEVVDKLNRKEASKATSDSGATPQEAKPDNILLLPERTTTMEDLVALKSLLQRTPGNNIIHIAHAVNGEQQIIPITKYPTSLTLKDAAKFQMILPCKLVARSPNEVLDSIVKAATIH